MNFAKCKNKIREHDIYEMNQKKTHPWLEFNGRKNQQKSGKIL